MNARIDRYMPRIRKILVFLGTAWVVTAPAAPVAVGDTAADLPVSQAATVTFMFENDLFGDTDQQYTNGIQIGWLTPDLTYFEQAGRLPKWSLPLVKALPWVNRGGAQRNLGLAFGQKMFTPEDIDSRSLVTDDRPYAGWLYGGVSFVSRSADRLDAIELQLGVVGPASLAEKTQNLIHDIRDIPRARGWDNQLKNEPGLALIYQRKERWISRMLSEHVGYDLMGHAGGALGNVFTYLNGGVEVRAGWNMPADFGTTLINPGGDTNAPVAGNDPRLNSGTPIGVHLFTAITGRWVVRDIFLDGNTFTDSHSVDKEPLVADLIIGASMVMRPYKLSYAQVFRTQEFDGQRLNPNFGSISLSVTF